MALSEKLKELRDRKNWSQQHVADLIKVDRSTISRYETGKSLPSYQTVIQFAEIYQVDKEYLVAELDQLLPDSEKPGYILKETANDKELELILQLIEQDPDLKRILLELHFMGQKRRRFFLEVLKASIKIQHKYKLM
ncbi:helix-turn-helix domain-containing protein [Bacillota bacterium Lsc_1132]